MIKFRLQNGAEIEALGFGTWNAKDEELENALELALEAGYRHIDTAYVYENEHVIGRVLKRWMDAGKLKREDLFIVTKLPPGGHRPSGVPKYLGRSLAALGLDYVDLYLIHTPFGFQDSDGVIPPPPPGEKVALDLTTDHIATWKAMEEQVDAGRAKAIGLSNFNESQIQRVLDHARIRPANLQVEIHAYMQQEEMLQFCKRNEIVLTAYSPLGSPGLGEFMGKNGTNFPNILKNPVVVKIGEKHGKSPAQVVLRYSVQRGIVVIPKSTNAGRLQQNLDIFSFELDEQDIKDLQALDKGPAGRLLDFEVFTGVTEHPEYPF